MLSATIYRTGLGAVPTVNGVTALQAVLRRFALKDQDHRLDPAKYDGTVTIGTIVALANAAPKLGAKIDPVVGHAADVIGLLKKPFTFLPYGDVIINFILSPWIVDAIYSVLLGIIRIIPGGSSIADSINAAIHAVKSAVAVVAAPVAAAIGIVIGANLGGCSITHPQDCVSDAVDAVADAASAVGGLVVDAANAVADAASSVGHALAKVAQRVWDGAVAAARAVHDAAEKFGCALINNDIVVSLTAVGVGIVASPATSAAVVAAAAAGKGACAALAVADLVLAIYRLLSNKFPPPPSLKLTPNVKVAALQAMVLSSLSALSISVAPVNVSPPPTTPPVSPVLPRPILPSALTAQYPPGSIAAFDPKIKLFRIAIPVGTTLNGLNDATHVQVQAVAAVPEGVPTVPLTAFQTATGTVPVTKTARFWIAVGASVLAAGGGVAFIVHRRRKVA